MAEKKKDEVADQEYQGPKVRRDEQGRIYIDSGETTGIYLNSGLTNTTRLVYDPTNRPLLGYSGSNLFGNSDVTELKSELAAAKTQFTTIQKQMAAIQDQIAKSTNNETVNTLQTQVDTLAQALNTAQSQISQAEAKSDELKAPILLPPMEDMGVRLVASDSLERLEEYRSDENKYYLFIGLFGGAVLGVLSNWFTNENFVVTRPSIIFIALLIALTVICIIMVVNISSRANSIRKKMLSGSHLQVVMDVGKALSVIVVNEIPNRTDVIGKLLGK